MKKLVVLKWGASALLLWELFGSAVRPLTRCLGGDWTNSLTSFSYSTTSWYCSYGYRGVIDSWATTTSSAGTKDISDEIKVSFFLIKYFCSMVSSGPPSSDSYITSDSATTFACYVCSGLSTYVLVINGFSFFIYKKSFFRTMSRTSYTSGIYWSFERKAPFNLSLKDYLFWSEFCWLIEVSFMST
jgi:hypothetical protein